MSACGLVFEPDDVVEVTVATLAKAAPYTEVATPNYPGVMIPRGGVGGVFITRKGDRTGKPMEAAPGRAFRLSTSSQVFAFQVGGSYGSTLYLECYRKREDQTWSDFLEMVDLVAGGKVPASSPAANTPSSSSQIVSINVTAAAGATAAQAFVRTANNNGTLITNRQGVGNVHVGPTAASGATATGARVPAGQSLKWYGDFFWSTDAAVAVVEFLEDIA